MAVHIAIGLAVVLIILPVAGIFLVRVVNVVMDRRDKERTKAIAKAIYECSNPAAAIEAIMSERP